MTPTALKRRRVLARILSREGTEPAQPHEPDFLTLFAHLADGDSGRSGERSHSEQNHVRVLGHVLFEERIAVLAAEDPLEVGIDFLDHANGALSNLEVLPPDFHHPVFVDLRSDGNHVVGMQQQFTALVGRQELLHLFLRRDTSPATASG